MSESSKKSVFVQIFIGVAVALLVGGSSPWWWDKIFFRQKSQDTSNNGGTVTEPKQPIEPNIPSVNSIGKFIVTGFNTPLFRNPDLSVPIAYLPKNKRLQVKREHKNEIHIWFEITYDNKTGWVPAMSVTLEQ
jgi:hypothetical protein